MTHDRRTLLTGLLIGLMVAAAAGCQRSGASAPPPAAVLKVQPVIERDAPITVEYVGTLVGFINAQIRPRLSGHLASQNYREGSLGKTGDLLFQVDPRPFHAPADQADAPPRALGLPTPDSSQVQPGPCPPSAASPPSPAPTPARSWGPGTAILSPRPRSRTPFPPRAPSGSGGRGPFSAAGTPIRGRRATS